MNDSPAPTGGLFEGAAWHYARYRPAYPQALIDDLVERFQLDGTGRLLDLGCGTGQLAIPLAAHVAEVVGLDPDAGMLVEAARCATAAGVTTVAWHQAASTDLPGQFGSFRMVTMGRSFHWMDREQVLRSLDTMLDPDGVIVLANDSCLIRPTTPWQQAVEDIQYRYLPPEQTPTNPLPGRLNTSADHQPHDHILANSPFPQVNRSIYEFTRQWTTEQVIGYLYSTSLPLARLLADRRPAFEQEVAETLRSLGPHGLLEPVRLEVLTATRR